MSVSVSSLCEAYLAKCARKRTFLQVDVDVVVEVAALSEFFLAVAAHQLLIPSKRSLVELKGDCEMILLDVVWLSFRVVLLDVVRVVRAVTLL